MKGLALLVAGIVGWYFLRPLLRPALAEPDQTTLEHVRNVSVLRDAYGVPHIYGKRDADAAFGLAYAHAQDDWRTIQPVLAASTGRLATQFLSMAAIGNDFYYNFVQVPEQVNAHYDRLEPATRAILEGYARGINYWAYKHPGQVDSRLFPVTGRDIAAGFAHKLPYMAKVTDVIAALNDDRERQVGDTIFEPEWGGFRTVPAPPGRDEVSALLDMSFPGSNAHAVAAKRSTDGVTRLNINSHQPWEGPVAWYEAHVVSEEGWNMTGGTFPGAPFILHGHNEFLGWAHTVNKPDLFDVYRLKMDPDKEHHYIYDGKSLPLERKTAGLTVDLGLFNFTIDRPVYASVHGPVFEAKHGFYAIRYAGHGRAVYAVEQWFRMNKARNFQEWEAAMRVSGIPMFNTVYADRKNIHYIYYGLIPVREAGFDYARVLPGDTSAAVWTEYLPYERLPQVTNPPAGYVQNCNATPFEATTGAGNPDPADYAPELGIETESNNRSDRSRLLFGTKAKISHEDFLKYKWDLQYGPEAPIYKVAIQPVLAGYESRNEAEARGLEVLRAWDGHTGPESVGATLAKLTYQPIADISRAAPDRIVSGDAHEAFRRAVAFLMEHYGSVEVPLGEVQRLRRGDVDLPVGGGMDVLASVHSHQQDGKLVGHAGDSYVLIVQFAPDRTISHSRHQYGNSNRPESPHYADQALDFTKKTLKPTFRDRSELGDAPNEIRPSRSQ